jgi:hypothetical protein
MKSWKTLALVAVIAFVPLAAMAAVAMGIAAESIVMGLSLVAMGMAAQFLAADADASMKKTTALSVDDAAASSAGIDLGVGSRGLVPGEMELVITAPALAVAELANTETMTYALYHDTVATFASEALLLDRLIVQTGADGAGAVTAAKRIRLPANTNRYIRVRATPSGNRDKTAKSFVVQLVF